MQFWPFALGILGSVSLTLAAIITFINVSQRNVRQGRAPTEFDP